MTPEMVIEIGREAAILTLLVSGPLLMAGLVVGVAISLFQAVTQIQELTLTFIPKILAVSLSLLVFLPWMINKMVDFSNHMFELIPTLVG